MVLLPPAPLLLLLLLLGMISLVQAAAGATADHGNLNYEISNTTHPQNPPFPDNKTQRDALLGFYNQLYREEGSRNLLNWDQRQRTCSWRGVMCNNNGSVSGLRLENLELQGAIPDLRSLANLTDLRTLSLMKNNLNGPFPNVGALPRLRSIYLSDNRLSGQITDDAFASFHSLKKLYAANNSLSGRIPKSLAELSKLVDLRLDQNNFDGPIPDLHDVENVNLSYNALSGPIPASLSKMNAVSFAGNQALCGPPLVKPCPQAPSPNGSDNSMTGADAPGSPPSTHKSKNSTASVVTISVVVSAAALAVICMLIFIIVRRNRRSASLTQPVEVPPISANNTQGSAAVPTAVAAAAAGNGKKGDLAKLTFLREDGGRFELADLLRASAEVLGSGCFASSYKAALLSGPMMVVKRFRQMNNVSREEFHEYMRKLGKLRHPNLLPVVAYYYRKEEKLFVTEYVQNSSLAVHLHGGQTNALDWPARLRIVKGVSKGLAYLYSELPFLVTPHGHLKSSNVLLNPSLDPVLTDYGLVPVINQEHIHKLLVAYKSPESRQHGRVTKKTDVWTLGILILEILTGKLPPSFLQPAGSSSSSNSNSNSCSPNNNKDGRTTTSPAGNDTDLMNWVASVAAQGGPGENAFDKTMGRTCEGEMAKLLKIGLSCCEEDLEKRLDVREAVERIDELRDFDEDFYSSYASTDGDIPSSRGLSDDFS